MARLELAGVEQHHPAADYREGVVELEVVEDGAFGDDVLKEGPQVGDVPLAVAQLVDEAALGLAGRDVEGLVESAIGGPDAQRGIEDQQRLAHRIDDVLRVILNVLVFNIFDQRGSFHQDHPAARVELTSTLRPAAARSRAGRPGRYAWLMARPAG